MEYRTFSTCDFKVSALGLGTWVMGGWGWGDAEDAQSLRAIEASLEAGVTLIDTAPVYGRGRSETIVGQKIKELGIRNKVVIATKCGLEWDDKGNIRRNSSKKRILQEIDDSRRRLQTDVIDIYQIHWPDESVPFEETMELLHTFYEKGLIRAIGLSNFDSAQMRICLKAAPVHSLQPPYNLFERGIEEDILPFCREKKIEVLAYGALCRGLLTGKFKTVPHFGSGDVRSVDPKFQSEHFEGYRRALNKLSAIAEKKKATLAQLAIRWAASQKGITSALAGARTPEQARGNAGAFDFELDDSDKKAILDAVEEAVPQPIGPEFMGPPRTGKN